MIQACDACPVVFIESIVVFYSLDEVKLITNFVCKIKSNYRLVVVLVRKISERFQMLRIFAVVVNLYVI